MTIADIQKTYWDELSKVYDAREARSITKIVFEKILELNTPKLSLERFRILTTNQQEELDKVLTRLVAQEPVQYVLEEADFMGLIFKVNKHVLIPRPETEELVDWINHELRITDYQLRILDIGTGSGCIPISIAKEFPSLIVEATDVSEEALLVAEENNRTHGTTVNFYKHDILHENLLPKTYDLIVSNPPYIAEREKTEMAPNVLDYEPHLALFAADEDDLIFYRRIAAQAMHALNPGGKLFFEINQARGNEVMELMKANGFLNLELRKDMSGRDRMVKGEKALL